MNRDIAVASDRQIIAEIAVLESGKVAVTSQEDADYLAQRLAHLKWELRFRAKSNADRLAEEAAKKGS